MHLNVSPMNVQQACRIRQQQIMCFCSIESHALLAVVRGADVVLAAVIAQIQYTVAMLASLARQRHHHQLTVDRADGVGLVVVIAQIPYIVAMMTLLARQRHHHQVTLCSVTVTYQDLPKTRVAR